MMAHYRIYYIDERGMITSGHDAICDTDGDALDFAHVLIKQCPRIELWSGTRLVAFLSGTAVMLGGRETASPSIAPAT